MAKTNGTSAKITTNAGTAKFHYEQYLHFRKLAIRDLELPMTPANAAYLTAAYQTILPPAPIDETELPQATEFAVDEVDLPDMFVEPETIEAAPVKKKPVATLPRPAVKAAVPAKKPAAKPVSNGQVRTELKKSHINCLRFLSKAKAPLTLAQLAKLMDNKYVTNIQRNCLGSANPETDAAITQRFGNATLIGMKYVRPVAITGTSDKEEMAYEITALGRKALEKALKS